MLSASTAVIGAVLGALLAYLVVTARPTSILRRVVLAVCGVLAQFGGVTLAFAFIATLGFSGVLTEALRSWPGIDIFGSGWLFELPGLILVYTYFQIPLMVIVFLPALRGSARSGARRRSTSGASTWQYWTQVGVPAAAARLPRRRCCCCSPTRSRPTRRPRRWSARAARSRRC